MTGEAGRPAPRFSGTLARWAAVVVLAFAVLHGPALARRYEPNSWLFADGAFYFATVQALADHGRLEQRDLQPQSWYVQDLGWNRSLTDDWSNVALGADGGWYPKHPVLLPLLAVPLYVVYGVPGTLAANVLLNLAFVLLVFLLGRRVAHPGAAALVAVAVAAMPFVVDESYSFSNDVLGAVLVLGALELAAGGRFGRAGILAGLSIWSRLTNGAFLPALVVVAVSVGGWRAVARASAFALVPLGLFGALNSWLFGAPWTTSYHRVLVREAGALTTAAHTRLFNVPFGEGLRRIVLAPDGAFRTFPLLGPGLAGLLAVAVRRRALALAVLLFCVLPMLVFAKYDWYRPHFLYPVYGASALGLAGILGLVFDRVDVPVLARPLPRWTLPALAVLLVALAAVARATRPDPRLLSSHVREAAVFLDDVPCDYFNIQNERWECSHWDNGGWTMTGRMLGEAEPVGGKPVRGLWLHPNPSGRWKRVVWRELPAGAVALTLSLGDASHPGPVQVEVRARGAAPLALVLTQPGEQQRHTLALAGGAGPVLEIRARADDPEWKHLVVEGVLVSPP